MSNTGANGGEVEPVRVNLGRIPALWPHSAVFVANIDRIFYGDRQKTEHLRANVTGFSSYGTRMFPILGILYAGQNLLLLNEEVKPAIREYFSRMVHLNLPDTLILPPREAAEGDTSFERSGGVASEVRLHPAEIMDGYVTDPELERFAEATGKGLLNSYVSSRNANDKVLLMRHLDEQGLPAFDGGEATPGRNLEKVLDALKSKGYRKAVIRSALGASGFGMSIVDFHSGEKPVLPDFLYREERVLCQGWIEPGLMGIDRIISPSVQFFCHDADHITLFDVTEQLLSHQSVHEGNIVPPPSFPIITGNPIHDELLRQARVVCLWVASTGYRGTGSIDFLVYEQAGVPVAKVCEVNARVTGATYPSLLARRFQPRGAWVMRNYTFEGCAHTSGFLDTLSGHDLLYEPGQNTGILPINVITDREENLRKAQILFLAPHPRECGELVLDFPRALPFGCIHDRD